MSEQVTFEVDDAIVLLLGAPSSFPSLDGRLEGITRLEKLIFLMEKETPLGEKLTEEPEFEPYNFGPFSKRVYQAVAVLSAAGLVTDSGDLSFSSEEDSWESDEIIGERADSTYRTRDITLTDRGRDYYEVIAAELSPDSIIEARNLKEKFGNIPLRQLIRYVYTQYPSYTSKSIIRDQVLGQT
jgi:uncharacterized protein YwgA